MKGFAAGFCLSAVIALLTACHSAAVYVDASSGRRIPVGSRLTLKQPLPVAPDHTRIFIQHGVVSALSGVDQYYPHCNFELRQVKEQARRILPDEFVVVRIERGFEQVVALEPVRVAALGIGPFFDRDAPKITRFVHLYLGSGIQPDVWRLTCHGGFDDMPEAELPTVAEIQETLGEVAVLVFPRPGG